jgi:hypothetical protein
MRRQLEPVLDRFFRARGSVSIFSLVLSLSMLVMWARYEAFWIHQPQPRANIRWSETVTSSERAALEAKYELGSPQRDSERTWSYIPSDRSPATLRRLLSDPAVEDTQYIDRQRFELTREASVGPLEGPLWLIWVLAIGIGGGLLAAWAWQYRRGLVDSRLWRASSKMTAAVAAGLRIAASAMTRGVPELRAEVLGFFRYFYAASLFLALVQGRLRLEPGRIPDDGQLGWRWLGWLASRPDLMLVVEYALLGLLVLFAIGLWTRIVYWLFAAGMTVWVLVWIESQHSNAHTWIVTIFMILCLIPVPWNAALSVDATIRRRQGRPSDSRQGKIYGYAVWMPGLILGTVWASAAYAKMDNTGPMWILGGAVKYHWLIDAPRATVDWGQWVASHHWAAVIMAGCGVVFEAVFLLSVFVRPGPWRHLLVSTGFSLLIGFYLFHGLFWWTWWLVFLSFAVPWNRLFDAVAPHIGEWSLETAPPSKPPVPGPGGNLRAIHLVLIVVVCVHAAVRLPAGFGRFESYSGTYSSTAEFDEINPLEQLAQVWLGYGSPTAVRVDSDSATNAILQLMQGRPLSSAQLNYLRSIDDTGVRRPDSPRQLTLTRQKMTFDWTNGRFNPPGSAVVVATLDLKTMTLDGDQSSVLSSPRPRLQSE